MPNIVVVPEEHELDTLLEEVERLAAGLERAEQVVIKICDQLRRIDEQRADTLKKS